MLLSSTSHQVKLITSAAGSVDVMSDWADLTSSGLTGGNTLTAAIATATTTPIVGSPGPSTIRQVKSIVVRNTHASVSNTVTLQLYDGTNTVTIAKIVLVAGAQFIYDGTTIITYDANGNILSAVSTSAAGSDTQIQFNDGGFIAGDPGLTWQKTEKVLGLTAPSSEPAAPSAGILKLYSKVLSGRAIPKWMPPSGFDANVQPAFFGKTIVTYIPSSSTNGGTATLGGFGMSWTAGGTVSHPTPSTGIVNQMHRTRYANVVTTTNQTLGIMATAAGLPQFWRGNSAGQGGFFFFCRYVVELWAANTCRIFVGLSDSTTAQVTLDIASMTGNFCAFAHDTTDGANVLWFITRDNTTTHKTAISGATIAAGQGFDFYMYCKPNDSTIYYRVDSINSGTTLVDTGETNNLPTSTAFMGPQIHMSNGTANTTVTTVAPSINMLYIESDH